MDIQRFGFILFISAILLAFLSLVMILVNMDRRPLKRWVMSIMVSLVFMLFGLFLLLAGAFPFP